jgi:signal transduction histidine kinase
MIGEYRVSLGSDAGAGGLWRTAARGVMLTMICAGGAFGAAMEPADPASKRNSDQYLLAGQPLSFRGVVTWEVPGHQGLIFVHDGSQNLLVARTNTEAHPKPGELVEVQGRTASGQFKATVNDARVKVAGTAPLPEPLALSARQLATRNHFGEWVKLEGMVHDAGIARGDLIMQVTSKTQPFYAYVTIPPGFNSVSNLVESTVEVTGVVWTLAGTDQRPYGFRLHVPGTNCIRVVRSKSQDVFDRAPTSARQLRALPESRDDHVKVQGIVTYVYKATRIYRLVLEDETGPIAAYLHVPIGADPNVAPFWREDPHAAWYTRPPPPQVEPGDLVELTGSPSAEGESVPLLHGGELRLLKRAVGIVPREVAAREALAMTLDHALVKLKARVLGSQVSRTGRPGGTTFWAQSDGIIFEARLPEDKPTEAEVPKNALVELTGLARPLPGQAGRAAGLQIEMRDRNDLRLVHEPSPLLSPTVLRWLGVLTATLLLALAWVWLLRKQVTRRTAELATSVEERKRAQEHLMKALQRERELIELKSSFVSIVSHEFRTPLGVIVSSVDILGRYFDRLPLEKRQEQVEIIKRATNNLSELVEDVLVLGKMEAGKQQFLPVPMNLVELCRKIVDEVLSSTHHVCPIEVSLGGPLDASVGDEGLIRLILSNLLGNAVKYSPAGAEVGFSVVRDKAAWAATIPIGTQILQEEGTTHLLTSLSPSTGPLLISAQTGGKAHASGGWHQVPLRDYVRFTVRDHGIGIPSEDQKKLFGTFTRGSNVGERPGTGLGLMIVKRCVELHGGTIELKSAPGKGTTVIVRLPMLCASKLTELTANQ